VSETGLSLTQLLVKVASGGPIALAAVASLLISTRALGQTALDPSAGTVIHYESPQGLTNPVARLQAQIASGKRTLKFEKRRGYLASLLEALNIPISSQTLVFSKTSTQNEQITPRTPRAVYFSSDAYVGWAPDCPVIDVAAMDPNLGAVFYTLDQNPTQPPQLTRRLDCLRCHNSARTSYVPGVFVRSTYTGADGAPLATAHGFISGHTSSLDQRWGGWYVSGTHVSNQVLSRKTLPRPGEGEFHLGNLISSNPDQPEKVDVTAGANLTDLRGLFDSARYLSPHSDIVALLVLEHQVRMHNLLTMADYETRYALAELRDKPSPPGGLGDITLDSPGPEQRIALAGETLLEYMLFRNEAPLKGPVKGTSSFASDFQRCGPHATGARSLRQFDLHKRLFRYPCSFLIYSEQFDGLPPEMKNYLWRRLAEILNGHDTSPTYAALPPDDRRATFEILRQTKPEFDSWIRRRSLVEKPKKPKDLPSRLVNAASVSAWEGCSNSTTGRPHEGFDHKTYLP